MKTKFTPSSDSNLLGSTIQAVRKNKGITQEELGRRVGLGKSSISKIEKGLTHISAEDAAILQWENSWCFPPPALTRASLPRNRKRGSSRRVFPGLPKRIRLLSPRPTSSFCFTRELISWRAASAMSRHFPVLSCCRTCPAFAPITEVVYEIVARLKRGGPTWVSVLSGPVL